MTAQTDFRDLTRALYRVVSSPRGQRDWESVRRYYHPDARLVRTGLNADGTVFARVMSINTPSARRGRAGAGAASTSSRW